MRITSVLLLTIGIALVATGCTTPRTTDSAGLVRSSDPELPIDPNPDLPHLAQLLATSRLLGADSQYLYSVSATSFPFEALNRQQLQLLIHSTGQKEAEDGYIRRRTRTQSVTLRTGKSLTLESLMAATQTAFNKHLATPAGAEPQVLATIGDARFGGEAQFVSEPSGLLRIDFVGSGMIQPQFFARDQVRAFLPLLQGAQRARPAADRGGSASNRLGWPTS